MISAQNFLEVEFLDKQILIFGILIDFFSMLPSIEISYELKLLLAIYLSSHCPSLFLSMLLYSLMFAYVVVKNGIGDFSAWHGPSSHSERPVGSEVGHTGPMPTDRFSHGGSGLIVPRPL